MSPSVDVKIEVSQKFVSLLILRCPTNHLDKMVDTVAIAVISYQRDL
jgi:hypothetical protein